jgi:hypothetical protein
MCLRCEPGTIHCTDNAQPTDGKYLEAIKSGTEQVKKRIFHSKVKRILQGARKSHHNKKTKTKGVVELLAPKVPLSVKHCC